MPPHPACLPAQLAVKATPATVGSRLNQHPIPVPVPNLIRIRIPRPPININNARLSAVSFGCFVYLLFNKTGARPSVLTARKWRAQEPWRAGRPSLPFPFRHPSLLPLHSTNNIRFVCVCPCYLLSFNFAFKRFAPSQHQKDAKRITHTVKVFPCPSPAHSSTRLCWMRAVVGVTRPCWLCVLSFFILRSAPPPTRNLYMSKSPTFRAGPENHHHHHQKLEKQQQPRQQLRWSGN